MKSELTTNIGTFTINVMEANYAFVGGNATVRGKTTDVNARFHRWEDGTFHLGTEQDKNMQLYHGMYIGSKWDGNKFKEATHAFRKAVQETLTPAVNKWISEHPEAIEEAKVASAAARKAERLEQITKHHEAIAALQAEIDKIDAGEIVGNELPAKRII